MSQNIKNYDVIIIGGGYTSLSAAYEISKLGYSVKILEKDNFLGGLAGSFRVGKTELEKFYHHWFTNDKYILQLIDDLGAKENIIWKNSNTGMYFSNNIYRLTSPLDLLKFKPLSFFNRLRLGFLTLAVRRIKDWKSLENITAEEWLKKLGGNEVYKIVWEPLLKGKFGKYKSKIAAVWFWNKIKLRGSSRASDGKEQLAYFKGGFGKLTKIISSELKKLGVEINLDTEVQELIIEDGFCTGVKTNYEKIHAKIVLATPALTLISEFIERQRFSNSSIKTFTRKLKKINYLANFCLVLELKHSLSSTYWMNVNDPGFPFVALIEHTNFESIEDYDGKHIVYLSKYLSHTDPLYKMNNSDLLKYSLPFIKKMFPKFNNDWVLKFSVWRSRWSQPLVEKNYSSIIPSFDTPINNFYICSMAQIYPEDRGTNYAVREGRLAGKKIANILKS